MMKSATRFAIASAFTVATALLTSPALAGVTVGSNDSGNCYPFTCNDEGAIDYYQTYDASAFSGPLTIDSITFYAWSPLPGTILAGNYDISFGITSSPLGADPSGSLANVASFYNGSLGATQHTIAGSSYSYDPSAGNLVLHVVATGQPSVPNGSGNGYMEADYTGTATTRSYFLSGGSTAVGTGALVTTFNGAVPEPTSWALMLSGFGCIGYGMRRRRRVAASLC